MIYQDFAFINFQPKLTEKSFDDCIILLNVRQFNVFDLYVIKVDQNIIG